MTQYGLGEFATPEDHWRYFLRRDAPAIFTLSFVEAQRRRGYHERRHTPQTSNRDAIPRSLLEEWQHLKGEAAMVFMLEARGFPASFPELHWGEDTAAARERSRRGNVMPGTSAYVPGKAYEGLIVRGDEARDYPQVKHILVWERRPGHEKEYMHAIGWLPAWVAWERGSNFGPSGTPLRHPDDRLVDPRYLNDMESFEG